MRFVTDQARLLEEALANECTLVSRAIYPPDPVQVPICGRVVQIKAVPF